MNPMEMQKLVGQKKFLIPLSNYNLYFKVQITEVKREFGHILAKIVPHIAKTFDIKNPPEDTWDFQNSAWVRLSTLKDKVDKIKNLS